MYICVGAGEGFVSEGVRNVRFRKTRDGELGYARRGNTRTALENQARRHRLVLLPVACRVVMRVYCEV